VSVIITDIERVDSTALGSAAPAIELNATDPPAAPGADISEGNYSGVKKVVHTQQLDKSTVHLIWQLCSGSTSAKQAKY
jgi:hypothetical protein